MALKCSVLNFLCDLHTDLCCCNELTNGISHTVGGGNEVIGRRCHTIKDHSICIPHFKLHTLSQLNPILLALVFCHRLCVHPRV